jgi:hypothetical protein
LGHLSGELIKERAKVIEKPFDLKMITSSFLKFRKEKKIKKQTAVLHFKLFFRF